VFKVSAKYSTHTSQTVKPLVSRSLDNVPFRFNQNCLKRFCRSQMSQIFVSYTRIYCTTPQIFTALRSYASAVMGVVILSVRPSVRLSHACFVTRPNPKSLRAIFLYHMKGESFWFSATQQWLVGYVPLHL